MNSVLRKSSRIFLLACLFKLSLVLCHMFMSFIDGFLDQQSDYAERQQWAGLTSDLTSSDSDELLAELRQQSRQRRMWTGEPKFAILDEAEIPINTSIFFVETNAARREVLGRTLCAIESAARLNPTLTIFFLIPSLSPISDVPGFMLAFENVHFRYYDIGQLVEGTRLEKLWQSGQIQSSPYALSHTSDLIRFTVLAKFGGLYNDQDVLHVKPVGSVASNSRLHEDGNFVISEGNDNFVTSAIIRLGFGHPMTDIITRRLASSYDPSIWNLNGPAVITFAVNTFCADPPKELMPGIDYFTQLDCGPNLSVLPAKLGCPIKAGHFRMYYDVENSDNVTSLLTKTPIFVHYFNRMRAIMSSNSSHASWTRIDFRHPLFRLMKHACPLTESNVLRYMRGGEY